MTRATLPTVRLKPLALVAALLLPGSPIAAQTQDQQSTVISYPAAFFAQYNPNTINDMLPWIPGISLVLNNGDQGGDRGLGDAENILINGERTAGKSNTGQSQLSRIPASELDYIEIIRGAPGDLGVRSGGQIINVVLKSELTSQSVAVEYGLDRDSDNTFRQGVTAAYSRQSRDLNLLLSVQSNPRYELRESLEENFRGDFTPNGTIYRDETTDFFETRLNANLSYNLTPADRLQFNVEWEQPEAPLDIDRRITDLLVTPPAVSYEQESTRDDDTNWEVGGNYEHRYAGGSVLRALMIASEQDRNSVRVRYDLGDSLLNEPLKDLVLNTGSVAEERIARSSFTWRVAETQNLEMGLEVAQNILESRLALGTLAGTGPATEATGGLPLVLVGNANSEVEEVRYEPFAVHNWQITPRLTLESALVAEFSEIEQTGDTEKTRDFDFLRPSLDVRYDLTKRLQLRGRAQKLVSQLNFGEFVAAADSGDEQRDTQAGNPELAQEETWHYEVRVEYRLPEEAGVLSAQLFHEEIENVIDRLDLTPDSASPTGATGNIGDATKTGLALDTSLRLGFINLPSVLLTGNLRLEDSEVRDPILGKNRRLLQHDRGSFSLGWRHDISSFALNYGINLSRPINGGRARFDVDRIERFSTDSNLRVFVEKTWLNDIIFNFEFSNLFDSERCRERSRFDNRISDPLPELIEVSCSTTGRQFALKVRTTF